jgi:hypothetical protein
MSRQREESAEPYERGHDDPEERQHAIDDGSGDRNSEEKKC